MLGVVVCTLGGLLAAGHEKGLDVLVRGTAPVPGRSRDISCPETTRFWIARGLTPKMAAMLPVV